MYLRQIGRHKLLTKEQEIELAQQIERGVTKEVREVIDGQTVVKKHVPSDDDMKVANRARDRMIRSNLRLVVSIAKGYQNRGCDLDDLIATGNIGLMKAVERFDWRRGFRFSTYGSWWIRQAVGREIASQGKSIRVPGRATNLARDLKHAREEFVELHGQDPTTLELAELLGVTESAVAASMDGIPTVISLDDRVGRGDGGDRFVRDTIPDEDAMSPFDLINRAELVGLVRKVLETLNPREEKILRMRFGISEDPTDHERFPVTQGEIDEMRTIMGEDGVFDEAWDG